MSKERLKLGLSLALMLGLLVGCGLLPTGADTELMLSPTSLTVDRATEGYVLIRLDLPDLELTTLNYRIDGSSWQPQPDPKLCRISVDSIGTGKHVVDLRGMTTLEKWLNAKVNLTVVDGVSTGGGMVIGEPEVPTQIPGASIVIVLD